MAEIWISGKFLQNATEISPQCTQLLRQSLDAAFPNFSLQVAPLGRESTVRSWQQIQLFLEDPDLSAQFYQLGVFTSFTRLYHGNCVYSNDWCRRRRRWQRCRSATTSNLGRNCEGGYLRLGCSRCRGCGRLHDFDLLANRCRPLLQRLFVPLRGTRIRRPGPAFFEWSNGQSRNCLRGFPRSTNVRLGDHL